MRERLCCWLGILITVATLFHPAVTSSCRAADEAAAVQEQEQGEGAAEEQGESPIRWFLRSSGLIGLGIFGLSVYFVALVIRLFTNMKVEIAVPMDVIADFRQAVENRDFQTAYQLARDSDSPLGRILCKGIEHLPNGLAEARHAMALIGESETVRMEKQISMMAVLGTLGPMIGLVGTLKGMIGSFSVIAISGAILKPSEVAKGISEALLLTFEGVSLSLPAIYFFAFFRNRVQTISTDAMLEADDLLQSFFRAGRTKAAAPAGTPTIARK